MRLASRNPGEGSTDTKRLRIVVAFIGALIVLSLPSIYYSAVVSGGRDVSHILEIVTENATNVVLPQPPPQAANQVSALNVTNVAGASSATRSNKPLVAIVVCTRSKEDWHFVNQTSLHTLLIPSVEKTVTVNELRHYRVEFVISFDKGDAFWEKETNRRELGDETIFPINYLSVPKNPKRKFQIPFNPTCRAAYEYGAEYMVRVNDDSEFVTTQWITNAIAQLSKYNPPNVGVVGPTCKQGNINILTHDFVHRTHLEIFNDYYPDEFDNWWIDDWISLVYGDARTLKMPKWEVFHHTGKHGTRYSVQHSQKTQLNMTVARGKQSISTFLQNHTGEAKTYKVLGTERLHGVWGPMASFHRREAK